ncbi:MAG: hypothetical protein ACNA8W_08800 [Bradymonadaceae bacterium]
MTYLTQNKNMRLWSIALAMALFGAGACESPVSSGPDESTAGEARPQGTTSPEETPPEAASAQGARKVPRSAPSGSPFQRFPTIFVENRGQADEHIDFYVHNGRPRTGFSKSSVTYVLSRPATAEELADEMLRHPEMGIEFNAVDSHSEGPSRPRGSRQGEETGWSHTFTVRVDFDGANPQVSPQGREKAETVISYFKGQREDWKTAIPTYHELVYTELWAGIDLVYLDRNGYPVETFRLSPGADPSHIRLAYHGAEGVKVDENGRLLVEMGIGTYIKEQPSAFQEIDDERRSIPIAFEVKHMSPGHDIVSYALSAYDDEKPLYISPLKDAPN